MLHQLQIHIPYQFRQVKLLEEAMTHSSYANEQQTGMLHNERLEFLGDAVLELCISQGLFRRFPDTREGELTSMRSRLVNQDTLACLARGLSIDKCIVLGKGEEAQGGRERDSLLSDAFEALLGAIFLDGGFAKSVEVIEMLFSPLWPNHIGKVKSKDAKSRLQEITQQLFKDRPVYFLVSSVGPEHDKVFTVRLDLPDGRFFQAEGSSVKRAEQTAAQMALDCLESEL
jgi:ribonuclease III, bacterial